MTENCIKQVEDLERASADFAELSIEQLLYSAIKATSYDEVHYILTNPHGDFF